MTSGNLDSSVLHHTGGSTVSGYERHEAIADDSSDARGPAEVPQSSTDGALEHELLAMHERDEDDKDPRPTWEEVASRYGSKIYAVAYRLTGDHEEAKDLTQDVFVRVYRNLDKYEPGTFDGWIYRVTKNLFLDRVRRHKRVMLEALPEEEWRQPEDEGPGPEEHLDQGTLRGDLEAALLSLPPDFRTAVVLCDVQGLSYEEVAEATGWPLGTVRSRIHRGRRLMRERITREGEAL